MTDIFISYSRHDRATARRFAEGLEAEGYSVWWDDALRSGEAFDTRIEEALRAANAVIVLWSKQSASSRWVRAEATLADRNRTLFPLMIEPCERPIMFELTHTLDLSHWAGDTQGAEWRAFVAEVTRFLDQARAPTAIAPSAEPPSLKDTLKPGQSGEAPSLAVLPFTNRSSVAEDEAFAEGMVEDVIYALAQGVNVRVLGSTATANLRRAGIADLAALGRQLGVRYFLEGNLRRLGASLRVTTQLVEAATGTAIWSARFDRPLAELGELQEELVTEIAARLDTDVYAIEMQRALRKPRDITAWEAVARSLSAFRQWDPVAFSDGMEEARRAIAIAPDYAPGHAMLACVLANRYLMTPDDPAEVERIRRAAERALSVAPDDAFVLGFAGHALGFIGYPQEGKRHTQRAVLRAPGSGMMHHAHGMVCALLDQSEEALLHLKTAERLSPGWAFMWSIKNWQWLALFSLGRWEEAEAVVDETINLLQPSRFLPVGKALLCVKLGRDAEARRHIQTALQLGWGAPLADLNWRRLCPNLPTRDAEIATIHALYAATEPAA